MGRQGVERLTAKAVAAAVSRAAKTGSRLELSDGGGLVLRCAPTGVATWTYAYRSRAAGGMRRVTLGLYGDTAPALSLAAARQARGVEAARNKSGDDPKIVHEREPRSNDLAVFAARYKSKNTLARHSMSQAVRRIVEGPKDEADARPERKIAPFTPHDLRRTAATIVQAARLPVDFVKALLNHNDKGVTGVYARWHMFEEKREAVNAIEAAVVK